MSYENTHPANTERDACVCGSCFFSRESNGLVHFTTSLQFANDAAAQLLAANHPGTFVRLAKHEIDNSEYGAPKTYFVTLSVYDDEKRLGPHMREPGRSASSPSCCSVDAAEMEAVIAFLNKYTVNENYRARTPHWRNLIYE